MAGDSYQVNHAFHHEDANGVRTYYTRDNEQAVSDLPASVLKDKMARGIISKVAPLTKAQRAAQDTLAESRSIGGLVPAVDGSLNAPERKAAEK